MAYIKKLIEVALPLEKINAESAREKSIRHGHPSTLHLWWARRPLAAARAVIWSSLVDDPSSHPEQFPTEEEQNAERQRLFRILEDLVVWENSNNEAVLSEARAEILKSTDNNPPPLLDPFAGGGAIPLEAQRLGLEAHAHDLNPVAVMINKAMIEIPPRFANCPPVNPELRDAHQTDWKGAAGLAEDVRYYGQWMKEEAFRRIGHLYPKVQVPEEQGGGEATVIAWIWARTVKCPNPACGCQMPLASSFVLSKKEGKEAWIEYSFEDNRFQFIVKHGEYPSKALFGTKFVNEKGKAKRGAFECPLCHANVPNKYIDQIGNTETLGAVPLAIVAEGSSGRQYLSVDRDSQKILDAMVVDYYEQNRLDDQVPHEKGRGTFASNAQGGYYGFFEFKDYFTKRQLIALTTFSDLVAEAQKQAEADAVAAGLPQDHVPLSEGGSGALAYGQAVGVYLGLGVSRMADIDNSLCSWEVSKTQVRHLFTRQAIPMLWDFAENNVFNNAAGDFSTSLGSIIRVIQRFQNNNYGIATQFDAQSDCDLRSVMVSTDPPYYDNIGYADLSDFFYIWMRRCLKTMYPSLFTTVLVPKAEELIATPYRHEGNYEKAKQYFENGMLMACRHIYQYSCKDVPVTIYYAYKQSDSNGLNNAQTSSGWETMLSAIIQSGFTITGTWPVRTELANRSISRGTNALASSIVLVCRRRPEDAPQTTRRNFINALRRELRPSLQNLQRSNIAPVDLAQSAIGPGMAVFSRYQQVLEADGTPMSVRSALQIINQELDVFFNEQDSELDRESRFCVELYTQCAFNEIKFGEADTLARAKNTAVATMAARGVMYAQKGSVHLLERGELPEQVNPNEMCIWLLTQQLTRAMETGGVQACAQIVAPILGSNGERAKDLAYRLYTIAERKGWASEAYAYNALVTSWPEIQSNAAALKEAAPVQMNLFDEETGGEMT